MTVVSSVVVLLVVSNVLLLFGFAAHQRTLYSILSREQGAAQRSVASSFSGPKRGTPLPTPLESDRPEVILFAGSGCSTCLAIAAELAVTPLERVRVVWRGPIPTDAPPVISGDHLFPMLGIKNTPIAVETNGRLVERVDNITGFEDLRRISHKMSGRAVRQAQKDDR